MKDPRTKEEKLAQLQRKIQPPESREKELEAELARTKQALKEMTAEAEKWKRLANKK